MAITVVLINLHRIFKILIKMLIKKHKIILSIIYLFFHFQPIQYTPQLFCDSLTPQLRMSKFGDFFLLKSLLSSQIRVDFEKYQLHKQE